MFARSALFFFALATFSSGLYIPRSPAVNSLDARDDASHLVQREPYPIVDSRDFDELETRDFVDGFLEARGPPSYPAAGVKRPPKRDFTEEIEARGPPSYPAAGVKRPPKRDFTEEIEARGPPSYPAAGVKRPPKRDFDEVEVREPPSSPDHPTKVKERGPPSTPAVGIKKPTKPRDSIEVEARGPPSYPAAGVKRPPKRDFTEEIEARGPPSYPAAGVKRPPKRDFTEEVEAREPQSTPTPPAHNSSAHKVKISKKVLSKLHHLVKSTVNRLKTSGKTASIPTFEAQIKTLKAQVESGSKPVKGFLHSAETIAKSF